MSDLNKFSITFFNAVLFCALILSASFSTNAQSSDQNFPTPVTTNNLSGAIKSRDVGDSRLTTYYFTFTGNQGDIFVNVVTTNLNGDIDIFAADGLRPLTKIVVYADSSDNETGRVIYLRKTEKIILRIQGRSPNDDAATFQIKFAGSFLASTETEPTDEPKLPEVKRNENSDVIVNSVGTIIGVKPKPTPEPKPNVAEKVEEPKTVEEKNQTEEKIAEQTEPDPEKKVEVVVTDNLEKTEETKQAETVAETEKPKTKTLEIIRETPEEPKKAKKEKVKKNKEKVKKEPVPNPLENIRLVVLLKDGGSIERPMSEVVKFGVEKGVLTIVNKNGSISRFSILDVAKVTIE